MVLKNYQKFIEMTSNITFIVAFCVGIKCPRKIHLNTQCGRGGRTHTLTDQLILSQVSRERNIITCPPFWIFRPSYGPALSLRSTVGYDVEELWPSNLYFDPVIR